MIFFRSTLAVLLVAASFTGSVHAQDPIPVDDETIFVEVEGVIRRSPTLGRAGIKVEAREGAVTLSGCADTMDDIATAGRLASNVRGVTAVYNQIRVSIRPWRA